MSIHLISQPSRWIQNPQDVFSPKHPSSWVVLRRDLVNPFYILDHLNAFEGDTVATNSTCNMYVYINGILIAYIPACCLHPLVDLMLVASRSFSPNIRVWERPDPKELKYHLQLVSEIVGMARPKTRFFFCLRKLTLGGVSVYWSLFGGKALTGNAQHWYCVSWRFKNPLSLAQNLWNKVVCFALLSQIDTALIDFMMS